MSAFGTKQTCFFFQGGGTRIVACNRYHRLIYIFSIFNVPANVPADLLALIGCYWTAIDATFRFWHKAVIRNQVQKHQIITKKPKKKSRCTEPVCQLQAHRPVIKWLVLSFYIIVAKHSSLMLKVPNTKDIRCYYSYC